MPKRLARSSANYWRVCPKAISLQRQLLASMPKGYLAPASFADEYAIRLSRFSIFCWRVCHKAISLQHQLLASMPKGYLAPAPIAGEYAQGLSHSSTNCWRVCQRGYLAAAAGASLLILSRVTGANCICGTTVCRQEQSSPKGQNSQSQYRARLIGGTRRPATGIAPARL